MADINICQGEKHFQRRLDSRFFRLALKQNTHGRCVNSWHLHFFQQMRQQGKVFEKNAPSMDVNQRMGAGTQPRGKLAPLLLSEFKFKVVLKSTAVEVPKVIADSAPPPFQGVPLHSKCISTRSEVIEKGGKGEKEIQISEFGVYRSPGVTALGTLTQTNLLVHCVVNL